VLSQSFEDVFSIDVLLKFGFSFFKNLVELFLLFAVFGTDGAKDGVHVVHFGFEFGAQFESVVVRGGVFDGKKSVVRGFDHEESLKDIVQCFLLLSSSQDFGYQ